MNGAFSARHTSPYGLLDGLVASVLRGLLSLEAPLPDTQVMAAQEALITLLSAALKCDVQGKAPDVFPLGTGLRPRIVEFITLNVHVLELSPDSLCRSFTVSRAHLYRAFANDGGVAMVLDAAYWELAGRRVRSRILRIALRTFFVS